MRVFLATHPARHYDARLTSPPKRPHMHEIRLAVCHPDGAARAGVATRLRGATVVPYGSGDCNAALICGVGPAPEELLRAGIRVLLAAEPCPPLAAIEALSNEARQRGVRFAVVNPERYLPSRQLIRKQLGGALGEAGLIRSHRWEPPGVAADVAGLPDPLIRDLDVALWLAGRAPDRVFAVEQKSAGRYLQVHLGFPHGGMALLDYASTLPPGDGYSSLSVIAASGAAYADDHQNAQLLFRGGRPQALRSEECAGQLAAIAQEFVDSLRAGRDFPASNWKVVFAVTRAAEESLASGRAVALGAVS